MAIDSRKEVMGYLERLEAQIAAVLAGNADTRDWIFQIEQMSSYLAHLSVEDAAYARDSIYLLLARLSPSASAPASESEQLALWMASQPRATLAALARIRPKTPLL
jgi:hypothetical protein